MNNDAVDYVQKFIKADLEQRLNCWKLENSGIIHDEDFYGAFHASHNDFKFSMGELVLINELTAHVKQVIEKKGIKYFSPENRGGKRKGTRYKGTMYIPKFGRLFTNSEGNQNIGKSSSEELQSNLYEKIRNILHLKGVDRSKLDEFDIHKVSIDANASNSITGLIQCILCDTKKEISVTSKPDSDQNVYWITSNFTKHLTKKHKLQPSKQTIRKNTPGQNVSNTGDMEKEAVVNNSNSSVDLGTLNTESDFNIDGDEGAANTTCIKLIIESVDARINDSIQDIESCIYHQISKQILKMTEISFQNKEKFQKVGFVHSGTTYYFDAVGVATDGNCLFGSFVHQIFGYKLLSKEYTESLKQLRNGIVKYINDNLIQFEVELKGRIYELKEQKQQKGRKNKVKIENFNEEANEFLTKSLLEDAFWGSSETIKAVSLMHKVNVLIFEENGTLYYSNGFNPEFGGTVMVAYRSNLFFVKTDPSTRRRNHYDSVVNLDTETILKMSEMLAQPKPQQDDTETFYVRQSESESD